jgi:hypothetical protein
MTLPGWPERLRLQVADIPVRLGLPRATARSGGICPSLVKPATLRLNNALAGTFVTFIVSTRGSSETLDAREPGEIGGSGVAVSSHSDPALVPYSLFTAAERPITRCRRASARGLDTIPRMMTSETTSQSGATSPGVTWWQRNARRIWLMARIVGVVAVIGLAAWWMLLSPVAVSTHTVTRGDVLAEVLGTGTLEARVSAIVGPKVPGLIVKIAADQGDHAKAGDTLRAASSRSAEAVLHSADASGRCRRRPRHNKNRGSPLSMRGLPSCGATATTQQLRLHSMSCGATATRATAGSSVLQLVSLNEMWITAWVDETELARLAEHQPARVVFRSEPDIEYEGVVARVGREADRETREIVVDVRVERLPANWAVGPACRGLHRVDRREDVTCFRRRWCWCATGDGRDGRRRRQGPLARDHGGPARARASR